MMLSIHDNVFGGSYIQIKFTKQSCRGTQLTKSFSILMLIQELVLNLRVNQVTRYVYLVLNRIEQPHS